MAEHNDSEVAVHFPDEIVTSLIPCLLASQCSQLKPGESVESEHFLKRSVSAPLQAALPPSHPTPQPERPSTTIPDKP